MKIRYSLFLVFALTILSCHQGKKSSSDHEYTNALINESSPYLLQHAHNPVKWYPWGDEALAKAKEENKLIIISIGYAACHWCHVMEHESFEDTTVARIMNENFVNIKVDREERPDVDDVYMSACQLVSGRGCGWPLNAFALPDGQAVWAGTYFPKDQWTKILNQFKTLAEEDMPRLRKSAEQITQGIGDLDKLELVTEDKTYTKTEMDEVASKFMSNVDFEEGGRKGEPKFPMPNNYEYLLKYFHESEDSKAREAVEITLDKMAAGGIYDQLGGGFARYSVDGIWMVPHFEKMLYDNSQLISLYSKAYTLFKKPRYKEVIDETIEFCLRELHDENGGFYSSLDADSEGVEGKFYVWDETEIDSLITDPIQSKLFKEYFSIEKSGNWEHVNILHTSNRANDLAAQNGISQDELNSILTSVKEILMKHRNTRVRPGLDDKILSSWNGLMIRGLAEAYKATGNDRYKQEALKTMSFIESEQLQTDFRLQRNYKDGKSAVNGFLDDYANTIDGMIALYQITFDEKWLFKSQEMTDYVFNHFLNEDTKMFNYASDLDPPLIAKKSEVVDNVIPSSNSMMARNLFKLGTYLYNKDYIRQAKQMMDNVQAQIAESDIPNFYSNWCSLYIDLLSPPYEVAIVGPNSETLRKEMSSNFIPNALLLGGTSEGKLELLKDKLQDDITFIYVCQNKVCKFPVEDVTEALKLMN